MLKNRLLLLLMCAGTVAQAQSLHPADTIPKRDSVLLLDELKESVLDNIPVVSLDDNDLGDGSAQNISSVLTAGRDPFFSAASYNFSPVRFRLRGYDADLFGTYMNGIPMENLDNGFTPWGLWGGLNDVMRNRDVSVGLRYNTFAFGDIGSTTNIDSRASKQRAQTSFGYAYSNRNYNHRWMLTHSTGMSKKGWAFTFSGSRRWSGEGYVPGTYYNGWSYFAGIDKRVGQKHLFSLVAFGAPTQNGRQGASTMEAQELAGSHYYNPYWGYQNGKKRNASVGKSHQPFVILTHDFRITNKTSLVTAAGYSFGDRGLTALDWNNAPDPRPDYYRYLPSYYSNDPYQQQQVQNLWQNNESARQINWDNIYNANRNSNETVKNAFGIPGLNWSGKRARYILEERITNTKRLNLNSVLNSKLNEMVDVSFGASYQLQNNNYFKKVNDLLGAEFYVDVNQFAQRDFPDNVNAAQNDLENPNRILFEGDRFGYDYNMHINRMAAWGQGVFKFSKVDFFLAAELSNTKFWRVGNVRNGLFPNNSYGRSDVNNFTNYQAKAGITYKINGRNYIYANGASLTRAPFFENAYISPRTRDVAQSDMVSEKVLNAEAGYIHNSPKLKIRLSGYYTTFDDQLNVLSFYHDEYQNFVNYALSNIDKVHFGGEFGFESRLTTALSLNGAAAVGRYFYDSRQNAIITLDNDASVVTSETIYSQNFRIASTPQEAYSLGLTYRSPDFWFVSLTGNYFDQMWLDFNPIRRTYSATQDVPYKSDQWNAIIDQTKWKAQYTVDFFAGYSWKLPGQYNIDNKPVYVVFNAGVNNLTNNKDIITGGYEQLRFDFENRNVNKFPPKVYYAYGLNYFLSATIRF